MYKLRLNSKRVFVLATSAITCSLSTAGLTPLDESELENVSGQAIAQVIRMTDPTQDGGNGLTFVRMRTGIDVEINANIEKLVLGKYSRYDQYTAKYKYDNGSQDWHDDRVPEPDADVILENVSLGAIVGGQLQPLIMKNPYIEFVYDSNNHLVGLRTGAESQTGHLGNYSDTNSSVHSRSGGVLSFSGNLKLDVGFAGFSSIPSVARANLTPTTGSALSFLGGNQTTQTLGDVNHKNTREFFLSLNTMEITYPSITGDSSLLHSGNKGLPGFSLNMTDGIGADPLQALNGVPKISNCFNGSLGSC